MNVGHAITRQMPSPCGFSQIAAGVPNECPSLQTLEAELIALERTMEKAREQGLPTALLSVVADRKRCEIRDLIQEKAGS
ncbi:MAG: hypothetical protein ACYC99_08965 [Candidatus Geothermincolia bacterium]